MTLAEGCSEVEQWVWAAAQLGSTRCVWGLGESEAWKAKRLWVSAEWGLPGVI